MPLAAADLTALTPEERFPSVLEQAKCSGRLPDDLDLSAARRIFDVYRAEVAAERRHEARPCRCPAVLLRALAEVEAERERGQDPAMGWPRLTAGVELVVVPGSHHRLMQEPYVAELSAHLRNRIAQADGVKASGDGAEERIR
jgi:thioesterase domain-containing protein